MAIGKITVGDLYYISSMSKIRRRARTIACGLLSTDPRQAVRHA